MHLRLVGLSAGFVDQFLGTDERLLGVVGVLDAGQPVDVLEQHVPAVGLGQVRRHVEAPGHPGDVTHVELVSAREARDLFPLLDNKGVEGAAWIEGDGYVDPAMLTQAYRGAGLFHSPLPLRMRAYCLGSRGRRQIPSIATRPCTSLETPTSARRSSGIAAGCAARHGPGAIRRCGDRSRSPSIRQ